MFAGEAAFFLPFVLARVFRPTLLDVFGITNLQLGAAFAVYGVVAMAAYFFGGPLADRYSARRLMAAALGLTGVGGVWLLFLPGPGVMRLLWAWWGLTTVLLFWAAMIRTTRLWGGRSMQGRAFGWLEGGRAMLAAAVASVSVWVFSLALPGEAAETLTLAERSEAFRVVILVFTLMTLLAAVLVWFVVPEGRRRNPEHAAWSRDGIKAVSRMRMVWLQAGIVVCAYAAYKATDDFSLLARDVLAFDDVAASSIGTLALWLRGAVAIAAGYLGDRLDSSRVILWGFAVLTVGCVALATGAVSGGVAWMVVSSILVTSIGVYAVRGLYFTLLEEGAIPRMHTGSAVGIVSVLGFTPDVFMGGVMGFLLDRSPGALGHQHVFAVVAAFGVFGFLIAFAFRRAVTR